MTTIQHQPKLITIVTALTAAVVFTSPVGAATREYTRIDHRIGLRDINNHNQGTGGDVFWRDGVVTHLGSLSGPSHFTRASAISDAGHVAGLSLDYGRGFIVTPEDTNGDGVPDRWHRDSDGNGINDLMIDLGAFHPLGGSEAADVNIFGQVVGWSDGSSATTPSPDRRGFVWNNGVMTDLGPATSWASAINDHGQVVGGHRDGAFLINPEDSDGNGIPDRWYRDADNNGSNDLMTIIDGGWAVDVNERGQVLSQVQSYVSLWTPHTPNGTTGSTVGPDSYDLIAVGINNVGQVIAWIPGDFANQGVLWEGGAFVDIIPSQSFDYIPELYAINDAGWIVAEYGNLLIPAAVPEPGPMSLSMLAAPMLIRRRKRRA